MSARDIEKAFDGALSDAAMHETTIRRAENELTEIISAKLLDVISARDLVSEADKMTCAATALVLSEAMIDGAAKGFGKAPGGVVPRHVLADFVGQAGNRERLANVATAKAAKEIDLHVMKRIRARSEKAHDVQVVHEGRPERVAEAAPFLPDTVFTGSKSLDRYPAKRSKR
jgi:hypothetical protein